MKKARPLSIIFVAIILLTFESKSQEYKLYPNAAFELGKGIDLRKIDEGKPFKLFKSVEPVWENSVGTGATNVFEDVITSQEDFEKSLGIDISLSARYMGASLDASYNLNRKEILNSSSITLLFSATSDFGKQTMKDNSFDNLDDNPKQLIAQGQYSDFIQRYGNYFVFAVRRTIGINVYVTLTSVSKEKKESITSQIKGGYSSGVNSVSASVNINSEISQASKQGRIRINLQSNGDTSGFAGVRDLLKDVLNQDNPFDKITTTLKNYIGQFSRQSSTITAYYVTPVTNLGVPRKYISWNEATNSRLIDLWRKYNELVTIKENYQLLKTNAVYDALATIGEKNSLEVSLNDVNKDLFYLSRKKDSCLYECQDSADIYSCCSYDYKFYKENDVFNKYWLYYNSFNHVYNYPSLAKKDDTIHLLDLKIPELKSKKIKVVYKYAFNLPPYPQAWASFLEVDFDLVINGKVYPNHFSGNHYVNTPVTVDENNDLMPPTEMFPIIQTDALTITQDSLKIDMIVRKYFFYNMNGTITSISDQAPIRLIQKNSIKIDVLE